MGGRTAIKQFLFVQYMRVGENTMKWYSTGMYVNMKDEECVNVSSLVYLLFV